MISGKVTARLALAVSLTGALSPVRADGTPPTAPVPASPVVTALVPDALARHVRDGRFQPAADTWARGAFPGASEAERKEWDTLKGYRERCFKAPLPEALHAEGVRLGMQATEALWRKEYAGPLCRDMAMAVMAVEPFDTWQDFQSAQAVAQPLVRSYLFAVRQAEQAAPVDAGTLAERLTALVVPDQIVRGAMSWGQVGAGAPPIPDAARPLVESALARAMWDYDRRNTAWLQEVVARDGWPRLSQVGERAAGNAWLVVQHSDQDPLFQLRMLRLMEPLVAQGEVRPRDYAYLEDRVMLALAGHQRYGTQTTCRDHRWQARTLEDVDNPARVDAARARMGLKPLAEYLAEIGTRYGTC